MLAAPAAERETEGSTESINLGGGGGGDAGEQLKRSSVGKSAPTDSEGRGKVSTMETAVEPPPPLGRGATGTGVRGSSGVVKVPHKKKLCTLPSISE